MTQPIKNNASELTYRLIQKCLAPNEKQGHFTPEIIYLWKFTFGT